MTSAARREVDVVVVGAGLSGLVAADVLVAAGRSVLVVEARDRVGGRTLSATVAGAHVDLGGTFVGPGQDRVLALAAALGVSTIPTWDVGDNLVSWRGERRRYRGTIPDLDAATLLDVDRLGTRLEQEMRLVPLGRPWEAPRAAAIDGETLQSWLRAAGASEGAKDLLAIVAKVTWGCEPSEVSLLHVLHHLHACGGLGPLLDTGGGAQQDHFPAGAQQLPLRLAERLGEAAVLGTPAYRIEWGGRGGAVVHAGGDATACGAVVVAVPPALRHRIAFEPALPPEHALLPQRWPQGTLSKVYAAYPTPFWRDDGLSGQALRDEGPVFVTFDTSPSGGAPGVLLGFIGGSYAREFDSQPASERRRRALAGFAALFGDRALDALDVVEQRWAAEPWSGGGPTAAVPPGAWTGYGPKLAAPVGPIHWAGSETADRWAGFLDGAVRAGERAADEVLRP